MSQELDVTEEKIVTAYDKNYEEIEEKSLHALCKTHSYPEQNVVHYYVKVIMGGIGKGQMYNPLDSFISYTDFIRMQRGGVGEVKYIKVKKEVYDYYSKFLKTKNANYYTLAQRSKSDG